MFFEFAFTLRAVERNAAEVLEMFESAWFKSDRSSCAGMMEPWQQSGSAANHVLRANGEIDLRLSVDQVHGSFE